MTTNNSNLQITHNYSICKPEEEEAIPIPISDWSFLKEKLKKIEAPKNVFTLIGTTFLGIFTSGILAAFTLTKELEVYSFRIWFITIFSLVIGIILILVDFYYLKSYSSYSKNQLVDEMDRIEKKYKISGKTAEITIVKE